MACKYCGENWVETYTDHCQRCGAWARFILDRPDLAEAIFADVTKSKSEPILQRVTK